MAAGTTDEEMPDLRGQRCLEEALRHPLRSRVHTELGRGFASPLELAGVLGKPLPLVAYHCRVLEVVGGLPRTDAAE